MRISRRDGERRTRSGQQPAQGEALRAWRGEETGEGGGLRPPADAELRAKRPARRYREPRYRKWARRPRWEGSCHVAEQPGTRGGKELAGRGWAPRRRSRRT